jgi:bifunctional DNA-binding transcriptional regulator/antitoxin component of YhaV-PrlF toxin-antitoxin module
VLEIDAWRPAYAPCRWSGAGRGGLGGVPWQGEEALSNRRLRALGDYVLGTKYTGDMSVQEYLVSSSGQMSLPASARHRWHLDDGGPVEVIDLGFGVLTVPKGTGHRLLDDLVSREDHAEFVRSLADDPDLATT